MAKASLAELAWIQFDRVIADATESGHTDPWVEGAYDFDREVLEKLLGVARGVVGKDTQAGMLSKALDVWLAYELRRAGFDHESVWPRATWPRVVPRAISALIEGFETKNGASAKEIAPVKARLFSDKRPSGLVKADANVLGKMYEKQVDVVLTDAMTGPEILISTKRMDGSIGNNAANRIEESYGDAKNLRGRHPLASLGFVFGFGAPAVREKPGSAIRMLDLLNKLSDEDDAYDAVALLLIDYDPDLPALDVPDDLDRAARDMDYMNGAVAAQIDRAPKVTVRTDLIEPEFSLIVPAELHIGTALKTLIDHVLRVTPVAYHSEARVRRDALALPGATADEDGDVDAFELPDPTDDKD
jgi:hypothetical protein